jgi:hypothetical protein
MNNLATFNPEFGNNHTQDAFGHKWREGVGNFSPEEVTVEYTF